MSGFCIVSQSVLIGRGVGCEPGAQVGHSIYPKYAFSFKVLLSGQFKGSRNQPFNIGSIYTSKDLKHLTKGVY